MTSAKSVFILGIDHKEVEMTHARLQARFLNMAGLGWLLLAGLLAASFLLAVPVQAAGESEVAVMPFVKGREPQDPGRSLTCPFGRLCYEQDELKGDADRVLTEMVRQKLVRRLEHRVVQAGVVKDAYNAGRFASAADKTPLDAALALGKKLDVDYVLVGNVWRFDERVGKPYGVEEPASVAFSLHLVDIKNQRVVWRKMFNETQQSLSENLLKAREFFKRGAKWLTAEKLAEYGVEDMMKSFPVK